MEAAAVTVEHEVFLREAMAAHSTVALRKVLEKLPIVEDAKYVFDWKRPSKSAGLPSWRTRGRVGFWPGGWQSA